MLELVESFVAGKHGDEARCEDGVVCTPDHVAVIDGATTANEHPIQDRTPGRFAMETLAGTIRRLDPETDAVSAIRALSGALAEALAVHGARPGSVASATVLIASARRREIWRVGNSTFVIDGRVHPQPWPLAEIPARMRSAYLRARLRAGTTTLDEIARDDPAQALIQPLLKIERVFRNAPDAGDLAYAAIDGGEVPAELIEQVPIPPCAEVVFASDGYPLAAPTLAEAEAYLQQSLADDPQRVHAHPEVKGVRSGQVSFDDRAYLRFRVS